jgi:hypothetical protein
LDTYVRVTSIKSSSTFKVVTKVTPCSNGTACLLHYIDKKTGSYRSARVFLSNVASEDDDANQTGADLPVTEDRVRVLLREMFKEHTLSTVGKEYKSGDRTLMTTARFQLEEEIEDINLEEGLDKWEHALPLLHTNTEKKVVLESEKEKETPEKTVEELKRQLQPKRTRTESGLGRINRNLTQERTASCNTTVLVWWGSRNQNETSTNSKIVHLFKHNLDEEVRVAGPQVGGVQGDQVLRRGQYPRR